MCDQGLKSVLFQDDDGIYDYRQPYENSQTKKVSVISLEYCVSVLIRTQNNFRLFANKHYILHRRASKLLRVFLRHEHYAKELLILK